MSEVHPEEDAMRKQCRLSLRKLSMDSGVFDKDETILDDSCANRVGNDDVQVGNVLGSGGFSNVCEFRGFKSERSLQNDRILNDDTHHSSESSEASSGATNPERKNFYAVKRLREDLSSKLHETGAMDLAIEAQFLTSLSHKNIVSLQALGDDPGAKDFCIIIDRVDRTLAEEIKSWKYRSNLCLRQGKEERKNIPHPLLHCQILPFALDIASALTYLHGKNILFRDLKPENIGIDFENNLKIFDFGLALELRQTHCIGPNQYQATIAGTRRYMSPEVASAKPYGLPSDLFSFAVLLSEMISQVKPFVGMSIKQHKRAIVLLRRRPIIKKNCPKKIKKLIQSSWNQNPSHRPAISKVHDEISSYLEIQKDAMAN